MAADLRTLYYDTVARPPLTLYPRATEVYYCDECPAEGFRWADSPAGVVYSRKVTCRGRRGGAHQWQKET